MNTQKLLRFLDSTFFSRRVGAGGWNQVISWLAKHHGAHGVYEVDETVADRNRLAITPDEATTLAARRSLLSCLCRGLAR